MKLPHTHTISAALTACLFLAPSCGGNSGEESCTPDYNALEQQRIELCQNRVCGDVQFRDELCGKLQKRSCGACKGGETCTTQGICAACTLDDDCWAAPLNRGYFCNSAFQCEKYSDYCENTAECIAQGKGTCEDNRCLSTACGEGATCDPLNNESCVNGQCVPIVPLTGCTAEGSTTGNVSAIQAFPNLTAPEAVFAYTPSKAGEGVMLTVTPAGIDFDPVVYVLSSLSPVTIATGADSLEQVFADEGIAGESELLLFTTQSANQTYYIVVTGDPSKRDGRVKQGRFSILVEDEVKCRKAAH